jgi:hypothetical protein
MVCEKRLRMKLLFEGFFLSRDLLCQARPPVAAPDEVESTIIQFDWYDSVVLMMYKYSAHIRLQRCSGENDVLF